MLFFSPLIIEFSSPHDIFTHGNHWRLSVAGGVSCSQSVALRDIPVSWREKQIHIVSHEECRAISQLGECAAGTDLSQSCDGGKTGSIQENKKTNIKYACA